MPTPDTLTKTEQEAVILFAAWDMIENMVNYELFENITRLENTNLIFKTPSHKRLFNILLGDFLSQPKERKDNSLPFDLPRAPAKGRRSDYTFLFYLRQICEDPQLNSTAEDIRAPLEDFSSWLEADCVIEDVWLPAIDKKLDIKVPRIVFLKICGDIAKHNFSRLKTNVEKICGILKENGIDINERQGFLVLPEFYEWFHTHLFSYHASTIVEFLNEIRWAMFRYLRPEFDRSFELCEPEPMYRYRYPMDCKGVLPRAMYWNLMNFVKSPPYFPRFTVTQSLKEQY